MCLSAALAGGEAGAVCGGGGAGALLVGELHNGEEGEGLAGPLGGVGGPHGRTRTRYKESVANFNAFIFRTSLPCSIL